MELPWNDFLVKCQSINGKVDTPRLMESDWEWLKQLCELGGEDCWSEVNKSFQQVTLTLRLNAGSYFLKLHRTASFPAVGPEIVNSLGSAFQHSWQDDDTLCLVYLRFIERCFRVDVAAKLCSDVRYPFAFRKWAIDEDDPSCMTVTLLCEEWNTRKNFELFLTIDWSEPNGFPRRLTCSIPECLQGLRLDEWDSSDLIADNLIRVFRNMIL